MQEAKKDPAATIERVATPFLQGRMFELVLCTLALVAVLAIALQVPLGPNTHSDQSGTLVFSIFLIVGVASAVMIRHGFLMSIKPERVGSGYYNPFHRWIFFWLLTPAIFIITLPWIASGALNDADMGPAGVAALIFFMPWVVMLAGFLAAAVVFPPIELTIRGLIKLIATKGKTGLGNLIVGTYLLIILAFIAVGFMAASTVRTADAANMELFAALLGLPGNYVIKDETLLWATRALGILMVGMPFVYQAIKNKYPKSYLVRQISSSSIAKL